jgi:hypothetical protein
MAPVKTTFAVAALLVAAVAPAQTLVYVPDNAPPLTAGNTIPFSSAAYTYMGQIPAALMSQTHTRVDEISFMPGVTNTFTAPTILIGMGHLPSVLPCPFTFPGPGGVTSGSFLDFTVMYDSSVNGPLSWPLTIDQWSPLGLGALGGQKFVWNGVNDVGVYVTFTGASGGGAFRRAPNGPNTRTYASTYQAATSTACGSLFALYIRLTVATNFPLDASTTGGGVGDLVVSPVSSAVAPPSTTNGYTFVSFATSNALGTGPAFGLYPDGAFWDVLFTPAQVGNPLHYLSTPGFYPDVNLVVAPGGLSVFAGISLDFVQVGLDANLAITFVSNPDRVTF